MTDIIQKALEYAVDLTHAMPVEGLTLEGGPDPGRVVKPNLDLVWAALSQRYQEVEELEATESP